MDLGTLTWRVNAETSQLDEVNQKFDSIHGSVEGTGSTARRSGEQVNSASRQMERGLSRTDRVAKTLVRTLGTIAAAFSVRQIQQFTNATVRMANEIDKASQVSGQSRERLQELQFAFGQLTETTNRQVNMALQRFQRRLGLAADDTGAAADTFDELGVAMQTSSGRMRSTETVLTETIVALGNLESESIRAAKASEVFGEEAGPMLAIAMDEGGASIERMVEKARELGIVLDEDLVKAGADAADQMDIFSRRIGTRFQTLVLENIDTIMRLAEALVVVAESGAKAAGGIISAGEALRNAFDMGGVEREVDSVTRQIDARMERILEIEQTLTMARERMQRDDVDHQQGTELINELEREMENQRNAIDELIRKRGELVGSIQEEETATKSHSETIAEEAKARRQAMEVMGESGELRKEAVEAIEDEIAAMQRQVEDTQLLTRARKESMDAYSDMEERINRANAVREFEQRLDEEGIENKAELVEQYILWHDAQVEANKELERTTDILSDLDERMEEFRGTLTRTLRQQKALSGDIVASIQVGGLDTEEKEEEIEEINAAWDRMLENMQREWANTFTEMFRQGRFDFDDFTDGMVNVWTRALGEMSSKMLMDLVQTGEIQFGKAGSFQGALQGGAMGGMAGGLATGSQAGSIGGSIGGAIGSIWGPIGTAIGSLAGSFIGDELFGGGGGRNGWVMFGPNRNSRDGRKTETPFGQFGVIAARGQGGAQFDEFREKVKALDELIASSLDRAQIQDVTRALNNQRANPSAGMDSDPAVAAQEALERRLAVITQTLGDEVSGAAGAIRDLVEAGADMSRINKATGERIQLEQQKLRLEGDTAGLREHQLQQIDEVNRGLQKEIWTLEASAQARAEVERMERQVLIAQGDREEVRRRELEGMDRHQKSLQRRIWFFQDQAAAAAERLKLEERLLQVQGDTDKLRQRELNQLEPRNRALQEHIWKWQDWNRVQQERKGIEEQLFQAQGKTEKVRELQLEQIESANRSIQKQVWAWQDWNDLMHEREQLEGELLRISGDTSELRKRELEELHSSNRAIQRNIWAWQDFNARMQERAQLEEQFMRVRGDEEGLRARQIEGIHANNRAIQRNIWAWQDWSQRVEERRGIEERLMQIQNNTTALRARENQELDKTNRGLDWLATRIEFAQHSIGVAGELLQKQAQEQVEAQTRAHEQRMETLSEELSAAQESQQTWSRVHSAAESALDQLMGSAPQEVQRRSAVRLLETEGLNADPDELSAAMSRAARIDPNDFSSRLDFQREGQRTASLLSDLRDGAGKQLTTEEQAVERLEQRIEQETANHEQTVEAIRTGAEEQIERLEKQLAVAVGIHQSIQDVEKAVASAERQIASLSAADIPQFASGGMHSGGLRVVGERGAELESTGPSHITSNSDLRSMLGGSSDALLAEVRQQREAIIQIARESKKMADIIDEWDLQGQPEVRDTE